MTVFTDRGEYAYEIQKTAMLFFPEARVKDDRGDPDRVELFGSPDRIVCAVYQGGELVLKKEEPPRDPENTEHSLCYSLFTALASLTGETPPWGMLTGVRPTKLMTAKIKQLGEEGALSYFTDRLLVSPEKAELARSVAGTEKEITGRIPDGTYSLYVSIPFCPTRCSYCSFISHSVDSAKKLIPDYLEVLKSEIAGSVAAARALGLSCYSVYIGGGTPTVLTARQLADLMERVSSAVAADGPAEFTVEAGRPDTITSEKLRALREYGADRISVNPQTFSQKVLDAIGRRHTPEQTEEAFLAARDEGFKNINMDLIAGLPGDSADSFAAGLNKALSLSPESVTVHTLALKRSARLVTGEDGQDPPPLSCPAAECAKMVGHALTTLPAAGYPPYYMYRQSRSVGNLENTGFAKKGCECVYNIVMMEETHTVIGAGAGAVTRLTDGEGDIKRICNHKYPFEYIGRFDGDGKNAGIREFYSRRAASEETE